MNVLVTGGAGYLGSLAAASLLGAGHRVRVLDSLRYGGDALLGLFRFDAFEFVRGDIRSQADLDASLEGVDAVVHLAAIVGDPACARDPDLAREVNHDASLALFDAIRRRDVRRFVFASTCSNYGRMGDPQQLVSEESQLLPLSLYAETKVGVELELLRSSNGAGPSVTVLRFATLYGISPRMRFDLTVNEFAAELARAGRLEVYGEHFWRPYLHVRDAADLILKVLEAPSEAVAGQVFNAGDTRENYRKVDLVDMIRAQLDKDVTIEFVTIEDDPRDYRVTFEKLERMLDFRATRTVEDGIREVLAAVVNGVVGDLDDPRLRN